MGNDRFRQYAWGTHRGQKVFNQIKGFGVRGEYDEDGDDELQVRLWFEEDDDAEAAYALGDFVAELIKTSGEDIGLERFKRADMSIYA